MIHARRWVPLALAALLLCCAASVCAAPGDPDLVRGCDALSVGDLQVAKECFERVVAGDPTGPLGHVALGLVYLHAGAAYLGEAEREFASAGATPEALAGLGWTAIGGGDAAAADAYFAEAYAASDPPLPNLVLARAWTSLTRGDAATCRRLETSARAINADDALADCIGSERLALLENRDSATTLALRAQTALRARADANLGCIRLNPPRAVLQGGPAMPRWEAAGTPASPSILLASPSEGGVVTGAVVVHALLTSAPSRAQVTLLVDGRALAATDRAPYVFRWDTSKVAPGPHVITVTVESTEDDAAPASLERSVIVREATPTPARGDAYDQCRRRLALWLSTARLSSDWTATLEYLARGRQDVAQSPEEPGWTPLVGAGGLTPPAGQGATVPAGRPGPKVAIYFDDGPNPVITPALLDILAREKIHASFFLVGKQCEKYPDLVRRIALEGHTIASHSYSHANLANLTPAELVLEVDGSTRLINSILATAPTATPRTVRFFRCPGGNVGAAVNQAIQRAGLIALDNLSYNTWSRMDETPEAIARGAAVAGEGPILLHNGDDKSVFVLPLLIRELRDKGCVFVTADEMLAGR